MRRKWRNHTGNQSCTPLEISEPASLEDLVDLVRRAERERATARVVGSHHSWSDVALTEGLLAEPARLRGGLLPLDDGCLREDAGGPFARVLAGTPLRQLNPALERAGLALPNMGGYDAQTLAGVVSTSTHGSGTRFGPFPDLVVSMDVVIARGEVVRVEPADGITDAGAFARAHGDRRRLIQDDRFHAAVCGMGCLGLVHSLVIRVRDSFFLDEVRTLDTWERVRDSLTEDGVLGDEEHYELFLNPYASAGGSHNLLVTTRTTTEDPTGRPRDKRERHPLTEWQSAFPGTWLLMRLGARFAPRLIAGRFDWLLDRMCDDGYADPSYKVFNIGEANKIPAYSSELAVSLEGGRHVQAVDRILALAAEHRRRLVHTSPIALRFVAASEAYASMMHGRPTMMIELIMVKDTRRGFELLELYERELADLGIRPHWGQVNFLDRTTDLRGMYPRWGDWLRVYEEFNATGVFNSPFTDRLGISRPRA